MKRRTLITIPVYAATWAEGTESFYVNLSNATGAIVAKSTGTVTITPPALWVTSSTADFGFGTVATGAYISETSGGEVTLAPAVGTEFSGTALPAGWTSTALGTGGTSTVRNGAVFVDGATLVSPNTYTAGRTLEFSATFDGQANENVGFGLTSALVAPYAMFGVKADGQLYARSLGPGSLLETAIAPAARRDLVQRAAPVPHRLEREHVVYWVDGTQRVTHSVTYKSPNATMRPAMRTRRLAAAACRWIGCG